MQIYKSSIIFILIFHFNIVNGQSHVFNHYSVNDGLSQSVVNCIYQDKNGLLWFGTQNGLNKFDGYSFKKYINNPTDSNSISDNWIYSITEDKLGNLLIATKKGLNILDIQEWKFKQIRNNSINIDNFYDIEATNGIYRTENDEVIVNKPPFILNYDSNFEILKVIDTKVFFDGALNDQTIPIIKDKNGFIWQGSTNGLSRINPKTGTIKTFTIGKSDSTISDNYISALFEDKIGNIWIGTRNGLNIYNINQKKFLKYYTSNSSISHNYIRSIVQDNQDNIWIGTEGGGLNKCSNSNDELDALTFISFKNNTNNPNSIINDIVLSLFIDNSNILWIGTLQGIDKLDLKEKKFKIIRKTTDNSSVDLLDNVIASIYKNSKNEIWVGNWGKGLNLINKQTNYVRHFSSNLTGKNYIPNDYVHVIFIDSNDELWIGTRNGIYVFNQKQNKFVTIDEFYNDIKIPDFSNNRIYNILKDSNNNIWIATQNGLHSLNLKLKTSRSFFADSKSELKISSNLIYKIIEDKIGNIWFATLNGLDKYDPKLNRFFNYKRVPNKKNTLCDNHTISLCEDKDGNIWVGTQSGLNKLDPVNSTFNYYSEKDGLPSLVIYNIIPDNKNNLWLTTGNGLAQYDWENQKFKVYDLEDGLQSLEFNLNAVHTSKDGELFFGGMNGINHFYPNSLKDNNIIPPVIISNAEIINESGKHNIDIIKNENLVLNHDDYTLTIEFSALEYTNPQKNKYAYKLEGTNNEWVELGNRRFVSFTNLDEGTHILKIKGSNNDGVWNNTGISLTIIKNPPWWRTTIAYITYVVLLVFCIFLFIRIRERNLIRERKILEERVAIRTKEISRQKEEILAQRDEIQTQVEVVSEQRNKISSQNKSLTDSIIYAKRIQTAALPKEQTINKLFPNYFTLFLPRDIVSGDFYWVKKITVNSEPYIYFSVVDCTGHGVPGGFVSMLGISMLNELIKDEKDNSPASILNNLRELIKTSLNQSWDKEATKDGLDMSLCLYKPNSNELQFAGANSLIFHVSDNKFKEYRGDNMPISIYYKEKPFTNKMISLGEKDNFYLFSDGYSDQFGGDTNKKFLRKNFRKLIMSIQKIPFEQQRDELDKQLVKWKQDYEQIDDITIFGIMLK